jgi:dethiobiotin synthetase
MGCLKKNHYLVLAIGTDIGKTYLVENICQILSKKERSVLAIKPIASGCKDDDKNSDPAKILTALGLKISQQNLNSISPWRFVKPVSPHLAGKINFQAVKKFCLEKIAVAKKQRQVLFIEAAGGVMTPINDTTTFLDLASELKIPVLLVSANYLGAISHTLSALEALKSKKITVEKVIINEHLHSSQSASGMKIGQMLKAITAFSKIEAISLQFFLKNLLD